MKKIIITLILVGIVIFNSTAQFTVLSTKALDTDFAIDKDGKTYTCLKNNDDKYIITVWNGQKWNELGGDGKSIFSNKINKILVDTSGNLIAFAKFSGIYFWNGISWSSIWEKEKFAGFEPIQLTMDERNNFFVLCQRTGNENEYKFFKWDSKSWQEQRGKFNEMFWLCGYKPYEVFCDDKGKFNVYTIDAKQIIKKVSFNESIDSKGTKEVEYVHNSIIKWDSKKWGEVLNQNTDLLDYEGLLTQYSCNSSIITDLVYLSESNLYLQMPNSLLYFDGSTWVKIANNKFTVGNKFATLDNIFKGEDGFLYVTASIPKWADVYPTFYLLKYIDGKFSPIWAITQNDIKNIYIDKVLDVKIDRLGNAHYIVHKKTVDNYDAGFTIYQYNVTKK